MSIAVSIASTSAGRRRDQLPWAGVDTGGSLYCYEMTQNRLTSFAHDKSLSTPFENSFDDKLRPIKSVLAYSEYIYDILIFLKVQKNININIRSSFKCVNRWEPITRNSRSILIKVLSLQDFKASLFD